MDGMVYIAERVAKSLYHMVLQLRSQVYLTYNLPVRSLSDRVTALLFHPESTH